MPASPDIIDLCPCEAQSYNIEDPRGMQQPAFMTLRQKFQSRLKRLRPMEVWSMVQITGEACSKTRQRLGSQRDRLDNSQEAHLAEGILSSDKAASSCCSRLQAVQPDLPGEEQIIQVAVLAHRALQPQLCPAPLAMPCLRTA